jgi:MFS transporter, PAT family, beta-lactamase induction signal transducer AmpG
MTSNRDCNQGSAISGQRMLSMAVLGFASGLPLALTAGTMQAWLTVSNVDIRKIGLFSQVQTRTH